MDGNIGTGRWLNLGIGIAMPLAVIRCSGWLGLAAQALALVGAACLLKRSNAGATRDFSGVDFPEGETRCAGVDSRTS